MVTQQPAGGVACENKNFLWGQGDRRTIYIYISNWGEPERAPHIRDMCARSIYLFIIWYDPEEVGHC